MSERQVIDCDGCEARDIKGKPLYLAINRRPDGRSGVMVEISERIDLCPACLHRQLKALTDQLSHEQARVWLAQVTQGRPSQVRRGAGYGANVQEYGA